LPREALLSSYEGWSAYAHGEAAPEPERLSLAAVRALGAAARDEYNDARARYHAAILVRTPQVEAAHEHIWDVLESNMQGADRVKGAVAIDAPPGLGKTTTVNTFGREFHRRQIARYGPTLDGGDTLHIPVCHVGFHGRMTTKSLNGMIFDYYNHPGLHDRRRRPATDHGLAGAAAESAVRHGTRLFIVDDIHFLKPLTSDGGQVSNQLKWLANEYPVTFLFAGVNLNNRGILEEGGTLETAQTARRWTVLKMAPFQIDTAPEDDDWRTFIKTVEKRIVLADGHRGMLYNLADYLFVRSSGYIGSLMDLVTRGIARAVRSGSEHIDQDLLDRITIDTAAEARRVSLAAEVSTYRKTGRRPAQKRA
jgi:hypothetical protein